MGGIDLPLPADLQALYGSLRFPPPAAGPYVIGNFVATLDGVVSLGIPGKPDGDAISGSNQHDSAVMGLLRAASDAVIVGAGTVLQSPEHVWTPGFVSPQYEFSYADLRSRLGKHTTPVCVVVTASGALDLARPLFAGGKAPVIILTTARGAGNLSKSVIPPGVRVVESGTRDRLQVPEIFEALRRVVPGGTMFLVEGGPHLIGEFIDAGRLDELFLTLSPRLAGRDSGSERAGLIAGTVFLPDRLVAGTLKSVRKGGSHLFLRYSFTTH